MGMKTHYTEATYLPVERVREMDQSSIDAISKVAEGVGFGNPVSLDVNDVVWPERRNTRYVSIKTDQGYTLDFSWDSNSYSDVTIKSSENRVLYMVNNRTANGSWSGSDMTGEYQVDISDQGLIDKIRAASDKVNRTISFGVDSESSFVPSQDI